MAAGSASSCTYLTIISSDALSMHFSITLDENFCMESIATCGVETSTSGRRTSRIRLSYVVFAFLLPWSLLLLFSSRTVSTYREPIHPPRSVALDGWNKKKNGKSLCAPKRGLEPLVLETKALAPRASQNNLDVSINPPLYLCFFPFLPYVSTPFRLAR